MRIYNYDSNTKEYLNDSNADKDPLEEDGWLIPAHATTIRPPVAVAKQARVFNEALQSWNYVPDFRNTEVVANDKSGRTIIIDTIGIKPEDVRFEPLTNEVKIKSKVTEYVVAMMDYLIHPTEEKKQDLITMYSEVIQDAN